MPNNKSYKPMPNNKSYKLMPDEKRDCNTGVSDGIKKLMVVLWSKRSNKNLLKNLKSTLSKI